jgi:5-methylcytosine-specific restriction endonuclease McrA
MHAIPEEILSLNVEEIDFNDGELVKNLIIKLLNVIEREAQINRQLQEEIQALKDEINRLKGEKGKSKIVPTSPKENNEIPKGRKTSKWRKTSKKHRVKIDRIERIKVDKSTLPPDAKYKGYRSVVRQNIKFTTDNVEYRLERYYSSSERKLYEAELPEDVQNREFGSELKAFIAYLYFAGRVTESKIKKILEESGVIISAGQISDILTKEKKEEFSKEKQDIFDAGLNSADYFHIDDTGGRHKGVNYHAHVICGALFTVFFILPKRDRETLRCILGLKKSEKIDKIMISDDAKQFLEIAIYHALCWIHEIRLYTKLNPFLDWHRTKLRNFLELLWVFYEQLKRYKENPDKMRKEALEQEFEELFSTKTGYEELDKRIELTRGKKERLLLVLEYPQIPLHNNPAEIALRELVIKRKISIGTRSEDGRVAWENMMSLLDTCRKQGISFFGYLKDIFSAEYAMPRLSLLISQNASNQ